MSGRLAGPASQAGGRGKETESGGALPERPPEAMALGTKRDGGIEGEDDGAPARTRRMARGDRTMSETTSPAEAEGRGHRRRRRRWLGAAPGAPTGWNGFIEEWQRPW